MSNRVYGYIRVSTLKQGNGVSLNEQRESIIRYAQKNHLSITEWFEEKKSAAKRGRSEFNRMMKQLSAKKADGVIIHKIDRSARNIRDWAAIGELIDSGLKVFFAHEAVDMTARGGRLSADIQAIVAADYIRNLREETRKGFKGRLKQGLYPLAAPVGYLNTGEGGKVKAVDKNKAPLIKKAFELYATGNFSIVSLTEELKRRGLTNTKENQIEKNGVNRILRNPFYMGLIKIQKTGETFQGVHKPIITATLFSQVQDTLDGKLHEKRKKHCHTYSKLLRCSKCNRVLTAEIQKGNTYYRCHSKGCSTSIREDVFESHLKKLFSALKMSERQQASTRKRLSELLGEQQASEKQTQKNNQLLLDQARARLDRLTDAFLDGLIERDEFTRKKEQLLRQQALAEEKTKIQKDDTNIEEMVKKFELSQSLKDQYFSANRERKREILSNICSNFSVTDGKLCVSIYSPYHNLLDCNSIPSCGGQRDSCRTFIISNQL